LKITFWALSGLVNGLTSTLLGLLVYFKNRKNPLNITYALACLSVSVWSYAYFLWQISLFKAQALFWCRVLMAGAIFIPAFYFHHIFILLNQINQKKRILFLVYLSCLFFLLADFSPFFVKDVREKLWFKYWPDAGILYYPFLIIWCGIVIYGINVIYQALKNARGEENNKLRYIFIATLLGWGGGATNYPLWLDIPIPPVGNILVSVYIIIVAYAIVKYRLMDIKIAFTRAGIFLGVYLFILSIPFIVLNYTNSGLLATSMAVGLATLGPIIYRYLQKKAETVLLSQQRHYQRILLQAALGMVTQHNLNKLAKLIVYVLRKTMKLSYVALFIKNKENQNYRLEAIQSQSGFSLKNISFKEDDPFIYYIKKNPQPFFFNEVPTYIKKLFNLPVEPVIIVSAFAGNDMLGFVLLGEKINNQIYTQEDIDLFKILSRQAALAIQNCIFFEESKQTQQKIFAAEKLASIGGMAEGLAHQIKNRLNQFSLGSGELKFKIDDFVSKNSQLISANPELDTTFKYLKEISLSMMDNVKKTDNIIRGILNFAKVENKENSFAFFPLKDIIDLSINLLITKHEIATFPLSIKVDGKDIIYGIKSQLNEVIYNLLDNAYEATQEKKMRFNEDEHESYVPFIEISLTHTDNSQIIKISDNGIGIKDEDKPKIFAPFFTTKSSYKSGSGIGIYVVKRIVEENLKGKIWFVSTYMKGTDFFIELPSKKGEL